MAPEQEHLSPDERRRLRAAGMATELITHAPRSLDNHDWLDYATTIDDFLRAAGPKPPAVTALDRDAQ